MLAVHDPADVFLNLAKLFRYYKWKRTCDAIFVFFTLTWITTRLMLFPCVVTSCWYRDVYLRSNIFRNHLFDHILTRPTVLFETLTSPGLLTVLQVLHVYWFMLIYRMIVKAVKSKGMLPVISVSVF